MIFTAAGRYIYNPTVCLSCFSDNLVDRAEDMVVDKGPVSG